MGYVSPELTQALRRGMGYASPESNASPESKKTSPATSSAQEERQGQLRTRVGPRIAGDSVFSFHYPKLLAASAISNCPL